MARLAQMGESPRVLAALDWLLTALHALVLLAFVLLWIPRRTARLHGWLVALTALSWLGLGFYKGFGYCILTDLHWRVKRAHGDVGLPGSFLKYAGDFLTGRDLPPMCVDRVATVAFIAGCGATLFRHFQARRA